MKEIIAKWQEEHLELMQAAIYRWFSKNKIDWHEQRSYYGKMKIIQHLPMPEVCIAHTLVFPDGEKVDIVMRFKNANA